MSQQIASFDPASATPAPIDTTMGQQASRRQLYVWNESNAGLTLTLAPGRTLTIPPWLGYPIPARSYPMPTISWAVAYTLAIASPPVSVVKIEVFEPDEPLPSTQPISLASRATNIGNQVAVTSSNSVINDGNAAPTQVVEGTPSGAGASQLQWNNDGSGIFGGGNDVVNNAGVFTAMALDAIPAAAIAAGTLDSDVDLTRITSDGGKLTSDGAGNVDATAFNATAACTFKPASGYIALQLFGSADQTYETQIANGDANGPYGGGLYAYDVKDGGVIFYGGKASAFFFNGQLYQNAATSGGPFPLRQARSAGGGAAGVTNWQGTTDPGASASEGDTWDAV